MYPNTNTNVSSLAVCWSHLTMMWRRVLCLLHLLDNTSDCVETPLWSFWYSPQTLIYLVLKEGVPFLVYWKFLKIFSHVGDQRTTTISFIHVNNSNDSINRSKIEDAYLERNASIRITTRLDLEVISPISKCCISS